MNYSKRAPNFQNDAYLLAHRSDIESMLIEPTLKASFDAISKAAKGRALFDEAHNAWLNSGSPGDAIITQMVMEVVTSVGTDSNVRMQLTFMDNTRMDMLMAVPSGQDDNRVFDIEGLNVFEANHTDAFAVRTERTFKWKDLRGFVVRLDNTHGDWRPAHFKLVGRTPRGDPITLYDHSYERDITNGSEAPEFYTFQPPPGAVEPVIGTFVRAEDMEGADRLKNHLANHKYEYSRMGWLNENVNARSVDFDSISINGRSILDLIENRAIEISGNWVAFPVASGRKSLDPEGFLKSAFEYTDDDEDSEPREAYVEQLLSLPTRGVFAEAKLGHCNANEIIDDTRFWDWQKSPSPYQAPDIMPADTGSRDKAISGLAPTQFPQSMVSIVNPGALPDPTGLAGAFESSRYTWNFRGHVCTAGSRYSSWKAF